MMQPDTPGLAARSPRGRKRNKHLVILSAATRLFVQKGFDQPTMNDVAAAAGVQKPTLYAYFDGKSVLVDAVIDRMLQDLPSLRRTDETRSLREQLLDVGHQLQGLGAHAATALLALGITEGRLSALQLALWQKRYEEFEEFLITLFKHRCSCGQPAQVARQFIVLVVGDLPNASAADRIIDATRIQSAVDLVLLAYPSLDWLL